MEVSLDSNCHKGWVFYGDGFYQFHLFHFPPHPCPWWVAQLARRKGTHTQLH